ncbi:sugar phosphate isomerase/epimerase family protein [Mucilaginibacter celer]|uniref:Sugar phosphate isomerase/epimerase n=1 Tax=Mucilaginibacter celer TaxID=2305508 RepID=A0A494VHG2_9SPHI|nr:sugar phosphate isomerase/epimerase family protein [Mucilaginibacter celer]AYL94136.1 sugar phosphate isomerase/epimerase [Mucilaginibacter celer]
MENISRKKFIATTALAAAGLPFGLGALAKPLALPEDINGVYPAATEKIKVSIFSKHLHWLNYTDMATLAAQLGFDGVDLTVRPDGHVSPERVTDDLPKAVEAIEKAGLKVYSIVTNIKAADEKDTEPILKAASALGIKYYRTAWFNYDKALSVQANIKAIYKQLVGLAAINKKYGMHGGYQNHSGDLFGASQWDLWLSLEGLDPNYIGCQYDVRHATTEGADTWPVTLDLLKAYSKTINVKDFYWDKKDGKWQVKSVPLGEGMVDFKKYFSLLKQYNINGPLSLHCEYPLGGAEDGARKLSISKEAFSEAVKKDLTTLRKWLAEYDL